MLFWRNINSYTYVSLRDAMSFVASQSQGPHDLADFRRRLGHDGSPGRASRPDRPSRSVRRHLARLHRWSGDAIGTKSPDLTLLEAKNIVAHSQLHRIDSFFSDQRGSRRAVPHQATYAPARRHLIATPVADMASSIGAAPRAARRTPFVWALPAAEHHRELRRFT